MALIQRVAIMKKDTNGGKAAAPKARRGTGQSDLMRTVVVLVPNLGSPHHEMVFPGINEALAEHGYDILFHNVAPEDREDPATLACLHAFQPAGYIILRGGEGRDAEHARIILEQGIPLVTLGALEGVKTHAVVFDNRKITRKATDYIIERGHRRLGYLAGSMFLQSAKQRLEGFMESLANHKIAASKAVVVKLGRNDREGFAAALDALKNPRQRPSVFLCFNDMLAVEVYRAARNLSLDIPGDLSVVGVDGIECAGLLDPPLTTMDLSPRQSGRHVAELLVKAMNGGLGSDAVIQEIEPKLVERESVRSI